MLIKLFFGLLIIAVNFVIQAYGTNIWLDRIIGYLSHVSKPVSSRILAGLEAMNGIILIGWSTAFMFSVYNELLKRGMAKRKRA